MVNEVVKTKLSARSERVKCVDLHPTEPWVLGSLYSGHVVIWNYKTGQLMKTFEVTEVPVRTAKFITRKQQFVCGADDLNIRVYDYNTMEKVKAVDGHADYIRSLAVHPSQPLVLSAGDDLAIKVWDWERNWQCTQVFEGHAHYVMQIVFNPRDPSTFASCSLDRTIKVWSLGSSSPNFTLEGHEKGVNCIDYFQGGDKPYLISGADDRTAKVWDYQARTCVQTLDGHTHNVSAVAFHPSQPVIITGSEDNTVRIWHSDTYRLESTLTYGLERVWAASCLKGSNKIALGFDDGVMVVKMGSMRPVVSMDSAGRVIWTRGSEVFTANVRAADAPDGERLPLAAKEFGTCEKPPKVLRHSPNGRFIAAIGDGEWNIYTALAWRSRTFGTGDDLVWAADSNRYAVREWGRRIRIFHNFEEKTVITPNFTVEQVFGGTLLGVRGRDVVVFYDWETLEVVRRIDDVSPSKVYWAENGELVSLICDGVMYILRYNAEHSDEKDDAGYEDAIAVDAEIADEVKTGVWVGECFIYSIAQDRLRYCVGGHAFTAVHLERPMYVLGYSTRDGRAILADKDLGMVGVTLQHELLGYMTAIVRGDSAAANTLLPAVPEEHRNRIARFLDAQNMKAQALEVALDPDMRFDLAVQLQRLDIAREIAENSKTDSKWRQLGDLALQACDIDLAEQCFKRSSDFSGLLLLYSGLGNATGLAELAASARTAGRDNIAFSCYFALRQIDQCIDLLVETGRAPEAAFLARTYKPSRISDVVKVWRESLLKVNPRAAEAIADPVDYPNLFSDIDVALVAEKILASQPSKFAADSYEEHRQDLSLDMIAIARDNTTSDVDVPASDEAAPHTTADVEDVPPSSPAGVTEPEVSAVSALPAISSPAVSSPAVSSPAVSSPAVSSPAVSSPAVSVSSPAPAVSSPTVSSPAVSSPAVSSPAVSSPQVDSAPTPVASVPSTPTTISSAQGTPSIASTTPVIRPSPIGRPTIGARPSPQPQTKPQATYDEDDV
eukprot:TRINITY_DN4000_c0_g1_i1.p1 TRINITY_DN4000_c0_g1~~TRINITY_DN4000_c0_g1_i1.p1  ORF type:complete len:1006 (-),score=194.58 TRINITY_DN4000_c0_g1_i1:214-3231(-)